MRADSKTYLVNVNSNILDSETCLIEIYEINSIFLNFYILGNLPIGLVILLNIVKHIKKKKKQKLNLNLKPRDDFLPLTLRGKFSSFLIYQLFWAFPKY